MSGLINLELVDDSPLDEDDFPEVKEAALPVAARWHDVATGLRLRLSDIDIIAEAHSRFPEKCHAEALAKWLRLNYNVKKFGPPTWRKLVKVIAADAGGKNPAYAQKVAQQHPVTPQSDGPRVIPNPPANNHSPPTPNDLSHPMQETNDKFPVEETGAMGVPPYFSFYPKDGTKKMTTDGGGEQKEYVHFEPFPREKKTKPLQLSFGKVEAKPDKKLKGLNSYEMKKFPHGIALIFNNEQFAKQVEREGTEIDEGNLIQTLRYLGYIVEVHRNRTAGQIREIFQSMKERDHSAYDSFVCCVLTHGVEGQIYGSDSKKVELAEITSTMNGNSCKTLAGKPKLFFIQACRGKHKEESVRIQADGELELPNEADFFFGYATPPGNVAWRDLDHGSWYVSELSRTLIEYSSHCDLQRMVTEVNRKVGEYKYDKYRQAAEFTSRLRKDVFFF